MQKSTIICIGAGAHAGITKALLEKRLSHAVDIVYIDPQEIDAMKKVAAAADSVADDETVVVCELSEDETIRKLIRCMDNTILVEPPSANTVPIPKMMRGDINNKDCVILAHHDTPYMPTPHIPKKKFLKYKRY